MVRRPPAFVQARAVACKDSNETLGHGVPLSGARDALRNIRNLHCLCDGFVTTFVSAIHPDLVVKIPIHAGWSKCVCDPIVPCRMRHTLSPNMAVSPLFVQPPRPIPK